jgi:release factor glutamine methyltransferase
VRAGTPAREALDGAITAIGAAGCDTPRLDAEVLLAHVLEVERARLLIDRDLMVEGEAVRAFQNAVRRRAVDREPVAYITGTRGFRNIELSIDSRALIPRPETETLIECALSLSRGTRVLDVCTGSGAVALALKQERADLHLTGSDISTAALDLARENATRLGLEVQWLQSDLLRGASEDFDAVLCNPPYVRDTERSQLAPEILRHEPPGALFAGLDGLAVIEVLMRELGARGQIKWIAIEVGSGQAQAVAGLAHTAGFEVTDLARDMAGIERVVLARR